MIFSVAFIFFQGCVSTKTQPALKSQEEEDHEYDEPGEAAKYEFDRTKDPATGKVPVERLLVAKQKTEASKLATRLSNTRIEALSWQERGPNLDVVGASNGNTRANNGITSGRIRAIMVDSNDITHKTVFVGGIDGGLWKTTDITTAPANWTLINDYLNNLAISAICQDPRPGFTNNMYFCTGEAYSNVDAVQGTGVFKSTDGGATWSFLASTSSFVMGTRILCDYLGNVYLATRGFGIQRSADGGATWTNITPASVDPDISDMEITATNVPGRLHISCGIFSNNAYRYCDNPETATSASWSSPVTVLPNFGIRTEIACNGNTLYALPSNTLYQVPAIYKSIDGGANWTTTTTVPNATWANGQGWYALGIGINPANANEVIVGGLDNFKSLDGGNTWSQISTWRTSAPVAQYVHADVHKILWYDGGNKLLFGCDGGIHYSADKGANISDRNQGLRIKQFYGVDIHPATTNYFLAGAQDNGTHQFSNPGLSSTVEVRGGDGGITHIDQAQPLFQFTAYTRNQYSRTSDGGTTWTDAVLSSTSGQFINPTDYDNTSKIMYCGDNNSAYRRWTNPQTGTTSAVVTVSNMVGSVTAVTVSPITANKVFLGTSAGKVLQIDNANSFVSGTAGISRSAGLPVGTVANIAIGTDESNLLAVFSNYGINNIWYSSNGGVSWSPCDGNLPDMPVRWAMFFPGDNSRVYIATETGVWETAGLAGNSTIWVADNTFPSVKTNMLKYRSSDRTIIAATHGRGVWTATLPAAPSTPEVKFQQAVDVTTEATVTTAGCVSYKDYTYNMRILNAPTGDASITLGIAGGTAVQGVDYALLSNTLTFPDAGTAPQPFTIRVYDDAAIENAETVTLNYSISGSTNAQPSASNQTFTLTINDNDGAPIAGGNFVLPVGTANGNASNVSPFQDNLARFRLQSLFYPSELNAAGINGPTSISSLTMKVVQKTVPIPILALPLKWLTLQHHLCRQVSLTRRPFLLYIRAIIPQPPAIIPSLFHRLFSGMEYPTS